MFERCDHQQDPMILRPRINIDRVTIFRDFQEWKNVIFYAFDGFLNFSVDSQYFIEPPPPPVLYHDSSQ